MYTSNINMTQHAATLPRKTTTSMMTTTTTVMAPNRNVYCLNGVSSSVGENNGGGDKISEETKNQQFGDYNTRRPTYGAYANMTLPRGPYLQYKFHANYDNNTINRVNSAKITNSSSNYNNNDNNNENRITLLKREFNGLPRAKLLPIPKDQANDFRTNDYFPSSNITHSKKQEYIRGSDTNLYHHQMPSHNLHPQYTKDIYDCSNSNKKFEKPINTDQFNTYQYHSKSSVHLPPPSSIQQHDTHYQGYSGFSNNSSTNTLSLNYVTLADVINVKPTGLNQLEGWALLCQSVQALQDMFLADTPPPNKIRPFVNPHTFQITSRGRVSFTVLPANMPLMLAVNDKIHAAGFSNVRTNLATDSGDVSNDNVAAISSIMINYLSPEYISCASKKAMFSESDIEKMWIFSLGVTLKQTISSKYIQDTVTKTSNDNNRIADVYHLSKSVNDVNNQSYCVSNRQQTTDTSPLSALDKVILAMCEPKSTHRASLMFLLDLNPDRTSKRRSPQVIKSVVTSFNHDEFNFTKVNEKEILMKIESLRHKNITLLINNSPLTQYHTLICPSLDECLPQKLTVEGLEFCLEMLMNLDNPGYRIGYNSPGALASVNHLHLHLLYIPSACLYVENMIISEYCKNHQVKPFSHIVIDLFKEVVKHRKYSTVSSKRESLKRSISSPSEGHRSDTDSGRSSDVENIRKPSVYQNAPQKPLRTLTEGQAILLNENPLKVTRLEKNNPFQNKFCSLPKHTGNIGYESDTRHSENSSVTRKHPVVRRMNKRNDNRRNTIEVNTNDLYMAEKTLSSGNNLSKSTNHIDKIGQRMDESVKEFVQRISALSFDNNKAGISLPDLTIQNIYTKQTNLKVRRHQSVRDDVKLVMPAKNDIPYVIKAPEFIANATLPPKFIDIADSKCQQKRTLNVLMINGTKIQISCNPITTTTQQVFEAVIKNENLQDNFFLGLCALVGGDFVFLPMDLKIYKVAPQVWINLHKKSVLSENVTFPLFLRVKLYFPTLRGVNSLDSRHLLYLQLRKNVLEQQILCTEDDLITLGGLALQAEIGDFKDFMRKIEYFTTSNYIPENTNSKPLELAKYLRSAHFCKKGMHPAEAEHSYIRYMQELKEYGMHLYSAVWLTDDGLNIDVYVAISLKGITIFERNVKNVLTRKHNEFQNSKNEYQRHVYTQFEWLEIENICYTKHVLCVIVHKTELFQSKTKTHRVKYKLRMDGRKSYFAFSLASEHHKFYLKLRNSYVSLRALADELNFSLHEDTKQDLGRRLVTEREESSTSYSIATAHINKIDKPLKSTGLRVRNLKKSMLNDNRLLKLKQKFLRRTKSSAAATVSTNSSFIQDEPEKQNKEDEHPRSISNASDHDISGKMRNKVKMGTRAFSAQFLNKSFDNIHNTSFDSGRFNPIGSCTDVNKYEMKSNEVDPKMSHMYLNEMDEEEVFSFTSGDSEQRNLDDLIMKNKENGEQACVIQTSIKSVHNNFNMPVPEETVSDSLLEKFENLSCVPSTYDRMIKRVTVIKKPNIRKHNSVTTKDLNIKEDASKYLNNLVQENQSYNQNKLRNGEKDQYTLGISIVQGSDRNVYVKDIVNGGPCDEVGVKIGDQILAVDGISLLNLPYERCIEILQQTARQCELIISQIVVKQQPFVTEKRNNYILSPLIPNNSSYRYLSPSNNLSVLSQQKFKSKSISNINDENSPLFIKTSTPNTSETRSHLINNLRELENNIVTCDSPIQLQEADEPETINESKYLGDVDVDAVMDLQKMGSLKNFNKYQISPSKSLPDLPKIVDLIPKMPNNQRPALPRVMGLSRKYIGPVKYPVTPAKGTEMTQTPSKHQHPLSLLAKSKDEQVFI